MKYGKKKESNVSDEQIIRESGKKEKKGEFVKKGKEREEEKIERRKNN